MTNRASILGLFIAISMLSWIAGCSFIDRHAAAASKSPLTQSSPSPDSVTLEIFFARAPIGDAAINGRLWSEIDEQRLPADLRRNLAVNGFRAGVVGGHVPDELARVLQLTDQLQTNGTEPTPVSIEEEPNVTLRVLQTRPGKRNEVICSGIYEQLPLLRRDDDRIGGHTYAQAEGRFALRSFPVSSNRVQLELVPELHYGEQQARLVGSDGIQRLIAGKPREVFEELRTRAELVPGEMLLMTSFPDRPGSLGHYFFTQPTDERTSQKLLVIRVAQGGSDLLFSNEPTEMANVQLAK